MTLVLMALTIMVLISVTIVDNGNDNYVGREQTQTINGIFILLVFLRHFNQYVKLERPLDELFVQINTALGQLIVTMFLFYSGYGVMSSILQKGKSYVNEMPKKRILKTALLFDSAILLYIIMNIILGIKMHTLQILLSFIGWSGVGNSTWYIFAILMMYLLTYIAFKTTSNQNNAFWGLLFTTVLISSYILVIRKYKESQYYNTVFCYAMGMWFAYFKTDIDALINKRYVMCLVLSVVAFGVTCQLRDTNLIVNQLFYLFFVAMVVMITMKIKIKNVFLHWCGNNLLGLYILQRIPMILLQHFSWMVENYYIYFMLCAAITCCLTVFFRKIVINKIQILF